MNKGALAMVAACMYPDPEKGGRGKNSSIMEGFSGVDMRRLSEARTVLELAPDLVEGVKRGDPSLADAQPSPQPGHGRALRPTGAGKKTEKIFSVSPAALTAVRK